MKTTSPTRRSFLVAAAGAALCSPLLRAGEPGAKKLRVGVAGDVSAAAFPFHARPDCVVVSHGSMEQVISDPAIDAVVIVTGAADHARHAIAALQAGKHVLCAPPAATSLDECHQLLDAVKQSGRTYMLAETGYWKPITRTARTLNQRNAFGRLYLTEADSAAQLIAVTDERLVDVSCVGATALFHTDRGNGLRVAAAGRVHFHGERMSLFADPGGATIVRASADAAPEPLRYDDGDDAHRLVAAEFVDACLNRRRPRVDVYEALACTVPGIVARQSAMQNGERLAIPSFDPVA